MFDRVATEPLITRWYFNQLTCRAVPCPGVYHVLRGMEATAVSVERREFEGIGVQRVPLDRCGRW